MLENKVVLSLSRSCWIFYELLTTSISDTKGKDPCVIIFVSALLTNVLDYSLRLRDSSVCQQKDSLFVSISVHLCCWADWSQDLCATIVSTVFIYLIQNLFKHLIVIWLQLFLSHEVGVAASKTDNLKHAVFRQTLQEKLECLNGIPDSATAHWSTAVNNEDKAKFALEGRINKRIINLLWSLTNLEILGLLTHESWHELSHKSNISIFLTVKKLRLLHASCLVEDMDVTL